MYKLITSARDTDDLSIGFDRDHNRRQREQTTNRNIERKYLVRFYLKDIFGFAEQQEIATYRLGCELTLTRNVDNAVVNKDNATKIGRIKINAIEWYVPQYTASV